MSEKALDPHMWNLEQLFYSTKIYNVPVYQRPYSWEEEQVITLLDDLMKEYNSNDRNEGYYTGNLIIYDKNEKIDGTINKYDIIDGQQRITTFSLILLAIYCMAHISKIADSDMTLLSIKSCLWKPENRKPKKEYRVVNLSSIEMECFTNLFNQCFDDPESIEDFFQNYYCKSKFEERIINNFKTIYDTIREKVWSISADTLMEFADYLLYQVKFIVIESRCKENKVFSMFESINSKGKKLEEIDLIKTYIFSRLDETSYQKYLKIWGELIIRTNDNLYDYLYTYIKAYLSFYRQNITILNFKTVCKRELLAFFNTPDETVALKKLLDDLIKNVDYYNMLSSADKAHKLVRNLKFRFYFKAFITLLYKHPKPLFFRALVEKSQNILSDENITSIVVDTVGFMIKFLSISHRDSKDVITMFSNIMKNVYDTKRVSKDTVTCYIAKELDAKIMSAENLKNTLSEMDCFEQNRNLSIVLLALYESSSFTNGKVKISYDQAFTLLNSFSDSFSFDHLLVQTPNKDSNEFKYYKDVKNNVLVLKSGNDFPEWVYDGMNYDIFTTKILNKIGNLRIYYRDKNSGRQNTAIELKEYKDFYNYASIVKRGGDLVHIIIDECIPVPTVNAIAANNILSGVSDADLPRMDKLIEYGLINKGDEIYITLHPDTSKAKLLDKQYVEYNGEKITINEWGCRVTGWRSIRIYCYTAIVGENETLHDKRLRYIQNVNDFDQ